jgi:hypothetical protein
MTASDWESWLRDWNRLLLERFDPERPDAFLDPDVTPEVVASGWLGFPGAGDAQLARLEARLGVALPPSYRAFLQTTNGFLQPGMIVPRLLAADEVDWYRTAHQDVIDTWLECARTGEPTGDYFEQYLPFTLQVSAVERVGSAVYLLNPKVVNAEGEWEAFYFAHWVPGADRYPSFRALMENELKSRTAPPPPPPPSGIRKWWDILRWIFRPE